MVAALLWSDLVLSARRTFLTPLRQEFHELCSSNAAGWCLGYLRVLLNEPIAQLLGARTYYFVLPVPAAFAVTRTGNHALSALALHRGTLVHVWKTSLPKEFRSGREGALRGALRAGSSNTACGARRTIHRTLGGRRSLESCKIAVSAVGTRAEPPNTDLCKLLQKAKHSFVRSWSKNR